jgi:hypothetical protein
VAIFLNWNGRGSVLNKVATTMYQLPYRRHVFILLTVAGDDSLDEAEALLSEFQMLPELPES